MSALREQLAEVAAYSLIGPVVLIALAYVYFCVRAPIKLYARRIEELRDLRARLGEAIDDLDEPPTGPGRLRRIVSKYAYPVALGSLLAVCVFLFNVIGTLGHAFLVNKAVVKSFEADTVLAIYLNVLLADQTVHVCDTNKLGGTDCSSARVYDKKLRAIWQSHGHLPKSMNDIRLLLPVRCRG